MMSGFKQFVLRGNVVDVAAFAAVVAALTKDLLTPLIAALTGAAWRTRYPVSTTPRRRP